MSRKLLVWVAVWLTTVGFASGPVAESGAASSHERARAAIERLGGVVEERTGPEGRREVRVTTGGAWSGGDEGLAYLSALDDLRKLRLGKDLTDAGLAHLSALEELEELDLHSRGVTDAGLAHLVGLTRLERLNLTYTQVTDAGLVHLEGLDDLVWLGLLYTDVTDAGLQRLTESLPGLLVDGARGAAPARWNRLDGEPFAGYLYKWGEYGQGMGQFYRPTGLALSEDPATEQIVLVVADTGNHRVRNYTHDGMFIDKWGERGTDPGEFQAPVGVAITPAQEVWVVDRGNRRLQRTAVSSRSLRDVPGSFLGEIASPAERPFRWLSAVALDGAGHLYVTDAGDHTIRKLSAQGELLATWGGPGAEPGELDEPTDLAFDASGHLYVVDTGNRRVQRLDGSGRPVAQWGSGVLREPRGIAIDGEGDIYVTDVQLHKVLKFDAEGRLLGWAGGEGQADGELREPWDVEVDSVGRIYVTDSGNGRIQVFVPR